MPDVLPVLGILLIAAAAADGHDLVISARDSDWALLVRTYGELLGGVWLLGGRATRAARIAALVAFGGLFLYDVARATGSYPVRPVLGRVTIAAGWLIAVDLVIPAALSVRGPTLRRRPAIWPGVALFLVAAAAGIAIDRSQVGQFPIISTASAGRSRSGLDYLVYLPDGYYRTLRRWPLILTLHGRGESSLDINLVRRVGLPRRIEAGSRYPFVVVAPQCPDWAWNSRALDVLLDEVLARYRIDVDRVYLCGNSMGGNGTWELAAERAERFAAVAPICGGGNPSWAGRLAGVPIWAFHGSADRIVPPSASERMVAAVRAAGGDARLTIYPGVGHDSWSPAFADPAFFAWLLEHRRGMRPASSDCDPAGKRK